MSGGVVLGGWVCCRCLVCLSSCTGVYKKRKKRCCAGASWCNSGRALTFLVQAVTRKMFVLFLSHAAAGNRSRRRLALLFFRRKRYSPRVSCSRVSRADRRARKHGMCVNMHTSATKEKRRTTRRRPAPQRLGRTRKDSEIGHSSEQAN